MTPENNYRCGHCGYEGPCYGNGFSAPWCKHCQRHDKLTPIATQVVAAAPSTLPSAPAAVPDLLTELLSMVTEAYDHATHVSGSALLAGEKKAQTPAERQRVYDKACRTLSMLFCIKDELEQALAPTGGEAEQLQTERDAARYRALRSSLGPGAKYSIHMPRIVDPFRDGVTYLPHGLDTAIDAAMGVHFAAPQSVRTSGEALGTVPSAQGWMPIETAPKDGSQFLIWTKRLGFAVVTHDVDDPMPTDIVPSGHKLSVDDGKFGPYPIRGDYPTHWMPLPPAPGALAAASPEVLPDSPDVQDPSRVSASPTDGGNQ